MSSFQIRQAGIDDAPAACAVLRRSITELCEIDHGNDAAFLQDWLDNKTAENVTAWIADASNIVYVAVNGSGIVGIAAMTRAGQVTLNYVSPDARFGGVSKALLAQLEKAAGELGLCQCSLMSTKTAQRFYRAAGYRNVEHGKPGSCIAMVKALK